MGKGVCNFLLPQGWGGSTSCLWEGVGCCRRLTSFRDIVWGVQIFQGLCPEVSAPYIRVVGFPEWASDVGMTNLPWLNIQLPLKFSLSCGVLGLTFVHCLRWASFVRCGGDPWLSVSFHFCSHSKILSSPCENTSVTSIRMHTSRTHTWIFSPARKFLSTCQYSEES